MTASSSKNPSASPLKFKASLLYFEVGVVVVLVIIRIAVQLFRHLPIHVLDLLPVIIGVSIGLAFMRVLVPIRFHDIAIWKDDRLGPVIAGPVRGGGHLSKQVVVPLSHIDLQRSKRPGSGESFLFNTHGPSIALSAMYHRRKTVRRIFEEIEKRQGSARKRR